jgi:hypothetical protein
LLIFDGWISISRQTLAICIILWLFINICGY